MLSSFSFFFPPGNVWKVLARTQDPAASLLLPSYLIICGSFLQSCLFQSLSASCQLVFSENYSTGRCIFNVFVLGREFHVLLLYRLDLLPQIKKKKKLKSILKIFVYFYSHKFLVRFKKFCVTLVTFLFPADIFKPVCCFFKYT